MRVRLFAGSFALVCLVMAACLDDSITGTRPLTITIDFDVDSALVNEVVTANYSATGSGMAGVIVNWGDGVVDTLPLSGTAVEVTGPADHTYVVAGTYDVEGTVRAQNGTLSAQTTITISN